MSRYIQGKLEQVIQVKTNSFELTNECVQMGATNECVSLIRGRDDKKYTCWYLEWDLSPHQWPSINISQSNSLPWAIPLPFSINIWEGTSSLQSTIKIKGINAFIKHPLCDRNRVRLSTLFKVNVISIFCMGIWGSATISDITHYTAGKWHGCKSMSTGLQSPCTFQSAPG